MARRALGPLTRSFSNDTLVTTFETTKAFVLLYIRICPYLHPPSTAFASSNPSPHRLVQLYSSTNRTVHTALVTTLSQRERNNFACQREPKKRLAAIHPTFHGASWCRSAWNCNCKSVCCLHQLGRFRTGLCSCQSALCSREHYAQCHRGRMETILVAFWCRGKCTSHHSTCTSRDSRWETLLLWRIIKTWSHTVCENDGDFDHLPKRRRPDEICYTTCTGTDAFKCPAGKHANHTCKVSNLCLPTNSSILLTYDCFTLSLGNPGWPKEEIIVNEVVTFK